MRISSLPRIAIQKAGSLIGRRRTLNFVEGSNVTLTVQDDAANRRVNCTIASSGGGGGSAALTQLIPYQSGSYYRSQYWSSTPSSFVFPGTDVICVPIQVADSVDIDRLRVQVNTAVSGKSAVISIYNSESDGLPTTAAVEAEVSVASTGIVEAVVSASLTAGLHWLGIHSEDGGVAVNGFAGGLMPVVGVVSSMTSQNAGALRYSPGSYTGTAADLSLLTPTATNTSPHVEFRVA